MLLQQQYDGGDKSRDVHPNLTYVLKFGNATRLA